MAETVKGGVVEVDNDKMRLLQDLTERIMAYSSIKDREMAIEIARKWVNAR